MGPHNEVNAVLAGSLPVVENCGGLHAADTFSSIGSNLQYNNVCIAENEEALPAGWIASCADGFQAYG